MSVFDLEAVMWTSAQQMVQGLSQTPPSGSPLTPTWADPLPDAVGGVAYSYTLTATGGTAPLTFGITAGYSLPDGLSLNPATGLISGTPTGSASMESESFFVTDSSFTPVPVIWESESSQPPNVGQYVYVSMIPISNDHKLQTLDRYIRSLQIDLNDQMNVGTAGLRQLRDQVDDFYYPRRIFSLNGQNATVIDTDESARREYGGYQVITFTVKFRASIVRPYS